MKYVIHNVHECEECRVERQEEVVFVQYYDMVPNMEVPADSVNEKINCIRLKWKQHWREKEVHERGNVFALCPMDSVRGRVHVVPAN